MNTQTQPEAIIEADPEIPVVRIFREFDAPPELVYRAHVDPELVKQWMGPRSIDMDIEKWDLRTGGEYRLNFGDGMDFFGRYIEVTPPSRIVWTNEEGGENGSVTTVTFEEKGGQTLLVMSELYPSKEALDAAGTGAADAMHETFAQLDELLAALP